MNRIGDLFSTPLEPINVGLEMFADDIGAQVDNVVRVDWSPPGGGQPEVIRALDALAGADRAASTVCTPLERRG